METLAPLTMGTATISACIFFWVAKRGYYAALLPGISSIMYLVLELDWTATNQGATIGTLRDTAWAIVEIGIFGGGALLAWALAKDFAQIGERIQNQIKGEGRQ